MSDTNTAVETAAVDNAAAETQPAPAASEEVTTPATEASGITIKYNHAFRDLTAEEAKAYAQMGVRYESITPMLDKLRAVASYQGKTVDEIVNALVEKDDADMRQRILDECKGDQALADRLIEVERNNRGAAYSAAKEKEQKTEADEESALHKRLADEFVELQKEFPDIADVSSLPKAVVEESLKNGKSLSDAYIIHLHRAERTRQAAEASAIQAAKASAGSAASDSESGKNAVAEAFRKAFRGK